MGLLPLAIVLVSMTCLVISALMSPFTRRLLVFVERIEPRHRVRWLFGLLAAPVLVGIAILGFAVAPCVSEIESMAGVDLRLHPDAICRFCLAHPGHASALAWGLAMLSLIPVARRFAAAFRAIVATRRLISRLRPAAVHRHDDESWVVPGTMSFVAGWPHGVVCIGEDLAKLLAPEAALAVRAHEAAHQRRGDIHLRLIARLFAAIHLPRNAGPILDALDLAIEQACDAEASVAVRDPLVVAQALIDVSRIGPEIPAGLVSAFTSGSLDARVEALCTRVWSRPARAAITLAMAVILAVAAGVTFDHDVHHAVDSLVELLAG